MAVVLIPADRFLAVVDRHPDPVGVLEDTYAMKVLRDLRTGREQSISERMADTILTRLEMNDWWYGPDGLLDFQERLVKKPARRRHRGRETADQLRARRERYRGVCQTCGGPTSRPGGGGPPKLCRGCYADSRRPDHGTNSRYTGGCRCVACKGARTAYVAEYRRRARTAA